MEKIQCKQFIKYAVVAILLSDKVDFRTKKNTREDQAHYMTNKESNHQEGITILNVFTPNNRATKW